MNEMRLRSSADDLQATAVAAHIQISDYDEIVEILRSRKFVQGSHYAARKTIMKDTLIVLDGNPHLRRRKILNPIVGDSTIEEMRKQHLIPAVERCMAEIGTLPVDADGNISADLIVLVRRCVFRIAAAIGGLDGLETPEAADRMVEQIRIITSGFTVEWSTRPQGEVLAEAVTELENFRRELFVPSEARRAALIARFRNGELDQSALSQDALTAMLLHKGDEWPDDEDLRLHEVALMTSGGAQTTASAFTLFILLLENWFKSHPEDLPLVRRDPNFLRQAAFESLRVAAHVPARMRTAVEDVRLVSGRHIKAGQHVALLIVPANMKSDDLFGPEPETFNPHRKVGDVTPWGLTFGTGAHMCPGRPLVTGGRSMRAETDVDGSMVTMARRLYAAGMRLDPIRPPVREPGTHYNTYSSVPVIFSAASPTRA
jgi:cytochrome P450